MLWLARRPYHIKYFQSALGKRKYRGIHGTYDFIHRGKTHHDVDAAVDIGEEEGGDIVQISNTIERSFKLRPSFQDSSTRKIRGIWLQAAQCLRMNF